MEIDKARLLQGERCSCGSHRLSVSDDWYIECKDCSDEWSAAELLVAEIKELTQEILFAIKAMQEFGSDGSREVYETLCQKYDPKSMSPADIESLNEGLKYPAEPPIKKERK